MLLIYTTIEGVQNIMGVLKTIKYHIVKAVAVVILLSLLVWNKICYHMDAWASDYMIASLLAIIISSEYYFTSNEKPAWGLILMLASGLLFVFSSIYDHMYWKLWMSKRVLVANLG